MPPFGPVSRLDLIRCLRNLGYKGPYSGGKHHFMTCGQGVVRIPNPHQGIIGRSLLSVILREAEIPREKWEVL